MEFSTTESEQRKLLRNGYMYVHRINLSEGSSMLDCIYSRNGCHCKAKVKLSQLDEFLDEVYEHTHAPSRTECKVTKVKAGNKGRVEDSGETAQHILGTELRNISYGMAANLPSLPSLDLHFVGMSAILLNKNMPPTAAHREDIPDLPHAYCTTTNGDP